MGDEGFEPESFQNDAFQMFLDTLISIFIPTFRRRRR